jgi:hypothetical protein
MLDSALLLDQLAITRGRHVFLQMYKKQKSKACEIPSCSRRTEMTPNRLHETRILTHEKTRQPVTPYAVCGTSPDSRATVC